MGIILGDFNICDPEEGRFNVWNQSFTDGDPGKTAVFHSFFPHVLEVAQSDYTRRDSTALGVMRTLSRIDRTFIDLNMAEARDFHCYSHVFENLVKQTIPSDHAVLVVWVRSSSLMLTRLSWKGALSLIVLLKVGPSLSLRPLTLMTMEGSSHRLTHFDR